MTLRLLRELAERPLPLDVHDPATIERLRALKAADLIVAFLPGVDGHAHDHPVYRHARVLAISSRGRAALALGLDREEVEACAGPVGALGGTAAPAFRPAAHGPG